MRLSKYIKKKLADVEMDVKPLGLKHVGKWPCYAYKVELCAGGYVYNFDYGSGSPLEIDYSFRESFFCSLFMDSDCLNYEGFGGFEEWARDLDMNPDSRKDFEIWQLSLDNTRKLGKLIGSDRLEEALGCENDI
jgi:hypothetical protein